MTDIRRRTQSPGAPHADEDSATGREGDVPVAAHAEGAVVRRTKDGWRVDGAELTDLTSAMVLADLLSAELAAAGGGPGEAEPSTAKAQTEPTVKDGSGTSASLADEGAATVSPAGAGETSGLRATIRQLEHALTARIRVEQAIGVLAERHRIQPRQAFEQLRAAARNRGRRVIDIATDVVASASNPLLQLPDELSRPRSGRQARPRRPRGVLGSE
jgi:ANTAR domain